MYVGEVELWESYTQDRESQRRDDLICLYLDWAEKEALKWYKKLYVDGVELNDFYQFARVGLIEAIDRFDYKLGNKFQTFAQHRVKGSILNGIFKYSEKGTWLNKCYQGSTELLDEIIDANKSVSDDSFTFLNEVISDFLVSDLAGEEIVPNQNKCFEGDIYSSNEFDMLVSTVKERMIELDEPVKSVMLFHYELGLSFIHISYLLDLSKGRISQLHKDGLYMLRAI